MGIPATVTVSRLDPGDFIFLGREGWSLTGGWKLKENEQFFLVLTHPAPTEYQIERLHQHFAPAPAIV